MPGEKALQALSLSLRKHPLSPHLKINTCNCLLFEKICPNTPHHLLFQVFMSPPLVRDDATMRHGCECACVIVSERAYGWITTSCWAAHGLTTSPTSRGSIKVRNIILFANGVRSNLGAIFLLRRIRILPWLKNLQIKFFLKCSTKQKTQKNTHRKSLHLFVSNTGNLRIFLEFFVYNLLFKPEVGFLVKM